MPIRPENKARYPKDWPAISARIRERDGNKCKWCDVDNHALGGRDAKGNFHHALPLGNHGRHGNGLVWPTPKDYAYCINGQYLRIIRIVLTVAHLDHTPEHCDDDNLVALCQRCHNLYDAKERRAGTRERRRAALAIRELF